MKVVYIVTSGLYEYFGVESVFDNMEAAQKLADEINLDRQDMYGGHGPCAEVSAWEVRTG